MILRGPFLLAKPFSSSFETDAAFKYLPFPLSDLATFQDRYYRPLEETYRACLVFSTGLDWTTHKIQSTFEVRNECRGE